MENIISRRNHAALHGTVPVFVRAAFRPANWKIVFALGVLGILLPRIAITREPDETRQDVILLHTNDLHFDYNDLELVEAKIARFRLQYDHVFLLDAGDFSNRPSRWRNGMDDEAYAKRLRFMVETMNRLGYNAATLGNHDLGYFRTVTRDKLRLAEFPFLGANVTVETENYDPPLPYVVLEAEDLFRIAVLGLCGGSYDNAEGIALLSPSATVSKYAFLRDENNVFMLLTHIGRGTDCRLAKHHGEIVDVIIGGHSHTLISPPELTNGVLIAQTRGHAHPIDPERAQYLGVIRLSAILILASPYARGALGDRALPRKPPQNIVQNR